MTRKLTIGVLALAGGVLAAAIGSRLDTGSTESEPKTAAKAPSGAGGAALPSDRQPATPAKDRIPASDWSPGNALVLRMFDVVERRPNVASRIRQRIQFGEFKIEGHGAYYQQGQGNQRRSRWELHTLVGGEAASMVQVLDGSYLWTDRRMLKRRQVTRLDLRRLRRELAVVVDSTSMDDESARIEGSVARRRGGMSQLLAELAERFDFSAPQEVRRGSQRALAVVGRWKPQALARLWPAMAPASAAATEGGDERASVPDDLDLGLWPDQAPHHVLLIAGEDDLFPYVLEYRRAEDARLAELGVMGGAATDPLARFDWFEVRFEAAMDAKYFVYSSSDVAWVDETARVAADLVPSKPVSSPVASRRKQGRGDRDGGSRLR